jgi:hypothetical protein
MVVAVAAAAETGQQIHDVDFGNCCSRDVVVGKVGGENSTGFAVAGEDDYSSLHEVGHDVDRHFQKIYGQRRPGSILGEEQHVLRSFRKRERER